MMTSPLKANVSLEGLSFDISILSAFKQTQKEKALHKEKQKSPYKILLIRHYRNTNSFIARSPDCTESILNPLVTKSSYDFRPSGLKFSILSECCPGLRKMRIKKFDSMKIIWSVIKFRMGYSVSHDLLSKVADKQLNCASIREF